MISKPAFGFARQKSCSNCDAGFICGLAVGKEACWCDELPHVSAVAGEEQDCLCWTCLNKAILKLSAHQSEISQMLSARRCS